MTEREHEVCAAIERSREEAVDFLRRLIRTPSVTGEEGEAQRLLRGRFQEMGLTTEAFVPDLAGLEGHPEFIPGGGVGQPLAERPNIIGRCAGTGGGPSVLVFGHVDTVPPGPRGEWRHDPFGGEIADGRMYGRGTADMKAGLAATFLAVEALQRAGVRLRGDVTCMSNIEEEIGGSGGVLACVVQAGVRADVALYPHPGPEKPFLVMTGSSGAFGFRVRVKGETTHGRQAHLGVNAITKAMVIRRALEALDEARGRTVRDELTERAYSSSGRVARATNLYLSAIRGGDWIYQVPAACEMDWMFTFPHHEAPEQVRGLVETTVRHACQADPWLRDNPATLEWLPIRFSPSRPFPDHPFVRLAQEATQAVFCRPTELIANPVGSDIRVTVNYGGMPSVIVGPRGDRIHAFDEWVDLDSYVNVIKTAALILMRWCGMA